MRIRKIAVWYVVMLLAIPGIVLASYGSRPNREGEIYHNGDIEFDEVWGSENPHVIEGRITVTPGNTLTIGSGCLVMINSSIEGGELIVQNGGRLVIAGERPDPVIVTSNESMPSPGDYRGIVIENGGLAHINHTNIRFSTVGIDISGGNSRIMGCTINHSMDWGIKFDGLGAPHFSDCQINDTGDGGTYSGGVHLTSDAVLSNSSIFSCDGTGVYISVGQPDIINSTITNTTLHGLRIKGPAIPSITGCNISDTWEENIHITSNINQKTLVLEDCMILNTTGGPGNSTILIEGSNEDHIVEVILLNSSYKNDSFTVDRHSNVTVKWPCKVEVLTAWQEPIEGAYVTLLNSSDYEIEMKLTGPMGIAQDLEGVEFRYGYHGYHPDRDHILEINYPGCSELRVPIVLDSYRSETVFLTDILEPTADPGDDIVIDQGGWALMDGGNSTDNLGIHNYTWTFEHGGEMVELFGISPTYRFDNAGHYVVLLNVTDRTGNWDTGEMNITAVDKEAPWAQAGDDQFVKKGDSVFFNAIMSSDNIGIVNFTWTFLYNGSIVELFGMSANHTFNITGNFNITLNVSDALGNWNTDELVVNVTLLGGGNDTEAPTAVTQGDISTPQDEEVLFNASESYDNIKIANYSWSFEYSGTIWTLYGVTANFTFLIPGNYLVTLNVTDLKGNWDKSFFNVTVMDNQKPIAVPGPYRTVFIGEAVEFNATGSADNVAITNYTWSLNDSMLIHFYTETFTYIFSEKGEYTVTLNVSDEQGNWAGDSIIISVVRDNITPIADAGLNRVVMAGRDVKFTANASTDNIGITSYQWTIQYIGEDTILYGKAVYFNFDIPGEYRVFLNVSDAGGNWDNDSLTVTVLGDGPSDDDDDNSTSKKQKEEGRGILYWSIIVIISALLGFGAFFLILRFVRMREGRMIDQSELDKITASKMDFIIIRKPDSNKFRKYELRRIQGSQTDIAGVFWITARDTAWVVDRVVTGSRDNVAKKIEWDIKRHLKKGYSIDYFGSGTIMRLLGEEIF